MSGQILELERSALEELERIEQAITDRIIYNPKVLPDTLPLSTSSSLNGKKKRPLRDTVLHELEISKFLDRYQEQCKYIDSIISAAKRIKRDDNTDNTLAEQHQKEVDALSAYSGGSQELINQYYEQVGLIKEFHRKYPNEGVEDLAATYAMAKSLKKENKQASEDNDDAVDAGSLLNDGGVLSAYASAQNINLDTTFSGEEFYGRFVDLISLHEKFLNLQFIQRQLSYVQYLDKLAEFSDRSIYPSSRLRNSAYFEYIFDLHKYLESFFRKTRILAQPESSLANIETEFDSLWESKKYPSWLRDDLSMSDENSNGHIAESSNDPLFCIPCSKRFTNEALFNNHLSGRKHKRNAANITNPDNKLQTTAQSDDFKLRAIASHEYHVYCLCELLAKVISDTKSNVERRQALTDRERQLEIEALEREATVAGGPNSDDESKNQNGQDSDDGSDDEDIYNPLKLPLGWDGKPIPFWLYKYQGLGVEFECEICGNTTYAGRKIFEKHFLEPLHVHGLRCLGIKPDPLFKGITKLADAMTLWEKINKDNRQLEGKKENSVEMEDDEGNVMSEKVYNEYVFLEGILIDGAKSPYPTLILTLILV